MKIQQVMMLIAEAKFEQMSDVEIQGFAGIEGIGYSAEAEFQGDHYLLVADVQKDKTIYEVLLEDGTSVIRFTMQAE